MRHRRLGLAVVLSGMLGCVVPVAAQSPSADQIIRALRPTGPSGTTRGIRALGPESGGAAGSTRAGAAGSGRTAASPQPRASQSPAVNLTVNFVSGSADLSPGATHALDELGQALTSSSLNGYRFRIEGHTDTVGLPEMNKALSERRAAAVVDYLAVKWRVDRARVEAVGMGQEQLAIATGPGVSQPRNRRVTVVNLGA